jgi:cytochrome P450
LPERAKLFLWLAASGRDPSVFTQPEMFDLRRPDSSKSLAFGFGILYCLGAALVAKIALPCCPFRDFRFLAPGRRLNAFPEISAMGGRGRPVRLVHFGECNT